MGKLKRLIWMAVGFVLLIAGLVIMPLPFVPLPGTLLFLLGLAILIATEVPFLSSGLIRLIDWIEKKKGWKIHSQLYKLTAWLKIFGLKIKKRH